MHLCMASSIRAMPEKEKPPAMRVDLYCYRGEFMEEAISLGEFYKIIMQEVSGLCYN